MIVHNLSQQNSLLNRFLAEIRDQNIQKDSLRFRRNLERIGEIMAYEISKSLRYAPQHTETPLGVAEIQLPTDNVVLGTILRAGLPFHQGFLSYFDSAQNAFVSAYRKYKDKLSFDIAIEYIASPLLDNKTLIVSDPMLATGLSLELTYRALLTKGTPAKVHFAAIIASRQGIEYLETLFGDDDIELWVAAVDAEMNSKSYIIPGLGDAGDLAYGVKD